MTSTTEEITADVYEWFQISAPVLGFMDLAIFRPPVTEVEANRVFVEDKGWNAGIVLTGLGAVRVSEGA